VAAGVVGLVIWPVWFAMDFKMLRAKRDGSFSAERVSRYIGERSLRATSNHSKHRTFLGSLDGTYGHLGNVGSDDSGVKCAN
jgi:hypothetical protein